MYSYQVSYAIPFHVIFLQLVVCGKLAIFILRSNATKPVGAKWASATLIISTEF